MSTPVWLYGIGFKEYAPLGKDLRFDVAVIGGGITGVTTAYLCKQAGLKVAVLEKGRCGNGETGHTSAHLTYVTDMRLHDLVETFGRDAAQAVWDAGQAGLLQIDDLVRSLNIDCEFAWVPGYLHAPTCDKEACTTECEDLHCDVQLAASIGYEGVFHDSVPFVDRCGVEFADQALFHPTKYLAGLLEHVVGGGGHVFERSEVEEIDDQNVIHCNGHKVTCDHIVNATHVPLAFKPVKSAAAALHARLAAYSTYVISGRMPADGVQPALYWDTANPYSYLRFQNVGDHVLAILGGQDHKTGQVKDTTEPFQKLEQKWASLLPEGRICKRWSGQVIHANDGLPFIGELAKHHYVATAFAGNGLTFGTFAALLIRDLIINVANPWRELFRPDRAVLQKGLWSYLKEGMDYPRYFLQDRLVPPGAASIDEVPIGAGRIVKVNGERLAVFRDSADHVCCRSAVCPHMGCIVRWNGAERTWDCPCHGSRFKATTGEVISGPAKTPLEEHAATPAQT